MSFTVYFHFVCFHSAFLFDCYCLEDFTQLALYIFYLPAIFKASALLADAFIESQCQFIYISVFPLFMLFFLGLSLALRSLVRTRLTYSLPSGRTGWNDLPHQQLHLLHLLILLVFLVLHVQSFSLQLQLQPEKEEEKEEDHHGSTI